MGKEEKRKERSLSYRHEKEAITLDGSISKGAIETFGGMTHDCRMLTRSGQHHTDFRSDITFFSLKKTM
jgi:hypothetical protein